ncbi:V-type ATP synthase subunit F [Dictyoglomus thermophilum]|uniref:ATP synthase (F/14-kDa) subunit n=2 Tax=Dictyoglomus thermophilum TaxID=14 RepID=B5YFA3_DICT6|nr:V-type ATP synthase subunit F [Dictyoglomus thermophilum]ACI19148.1 ATP synthase (F/14-kDa) subunit [Dictyoglomus thermophilum H-6-12]MCX7719872.1 V-type ATP synthase subunit F [Dictyoglomus thermophilum]TYT22677.1 V-type ATP synthase subunit F [Dictyoglomus thermophilum]
MNENKIAIIGLGSLIEVFRIFGLDVYPVRNPDEAYEIYMSLSEKEYSLIIVLESVAGKIVENLKGKGKIPLILPDTFSNRKMGEELLRDMAEKALGIDIISEGEGYYGRKNS